MTTDQHDTSDRRCSCGELLTCLAATPAPLDVMTPCLFVPPHEPFYCRIHADVRLRLTDERCRRAAAPAPLANLESSDQATPALLDGGHVHDEDCPGCIAATPAPLTDCGCPETGHYVDCHRSWYGVLRPAATPAPLDGYVTVRTADLQAVRDMLEKAQALNAALLPAVVAAAAAEHAGPSPANGPKREYIGYAEPKEADRE